MEKDHRSCPKIVCEKIYKTIAFSYPFHRIRRRPQSPFPIDTAAATTPPVRTFNVQKKPVAAKPVAARVSSPARGANLPETGKEREEAEVIQIKFDYSAPKNGQVPQWAADTAPGAQLAPTRPAKLSETFAGQRQGQGKGLVPKSKPVVPGLTQPGAAAQQGTGQSRPVIRGMTQPGTAAKPGSGQVSFEPELSVRDKYKSRAEKIPPKKAAPVRQSNADEKEESSKSGDHDYFTQAINRMKNRIRAASNLNEGSIAPEAGSTKDTSKERSKESFKDPFSDYIRRAKVKIRTTTMAVGSADSFK